nr:hypothetical protein [Nakamurella multipartita]
MVLTGAPFDLGVDEPVCPTRLGTAAADQQALEVVIEHAVAVAVAGARLKDVLDAVEEGLADDRLMTPLDEASVDLNPACEERVAENVLDSGAADRSGVRHLRRGPLGEAEVDRSQMEFLLGVVPGRVELEDLPDERCSLRVERDGVEQLAVVALPDIEIADLRATVVAAGQHLVAHLGFDVLAVAAGFKLVENVGDGFHGVSHVAFAEVFTGADKFDAELGQVSFGDNRIAQVAEGSRAHIDDDVVNARRRHHVLQQLFELRTLVDRERRVSRLDKFLVDNRSEVPCFPGRELTLGGDGQSIGVDIRGGVHLSRCRHAQISDSSRGCHLGVFGHT